jgi:UDP-GlcNAc:undecaprenyl-phosphate GlcNAc-1-phosphate transferase
VRDYVLTLLVAAAVTYLLTPLVRRLAGRVGAMKQPRDRDVHVVPVPTLGGLAMYGGLAAGLLVAEQIQQLRIALANTGMLGLLLAGGLLVVIGFIDDRWGMDALPKAAGQVAAGGILVATGTSLSWLPLPGGHTYIPTTDQATLLTILIVVATINAVNFIDGLDGLAAGIVCIAAVSFFLYYYTLTRVIDISALAAPALASAILIGMCLGFLPHNFSPATIFMGDTGAMLLGLLLAYAPIASINSLPSAYLTSQINRYPVILPLLLPAALLLIPYGDMLMAVVRRTRAGRSPFAPDRKHLHHRLLDIGHSQRTSVLIMYLWAAAFSGTVVWLSIQKTVQRGNSNHHGAPIVVFVIITAAAFAVLLLLSMPRLRWWQRPQLGTAGDAATAGAATANAAADGPALGAPVPEAAVPAGSRLVGVTAAPAWTKTESAEPAPATPPIAGPLLPAAPLRTPPTAGLGLSQPPLSARPPAEHLPVEPGSRASDQDWPARPPAGRPDPLAGRHDRPAWPADRPSRSSWPADQATPNASEAAQSLAFWRHTAAESSGGARRAHGRADTRVPGTGSALPATGLPNTGLPNTGHLPPTGRSVIGTPPPAVSGRPGTWRATDRAPAELPETLLPPSADGGKPRPDALP